MLHQLRAVSVKLNVAMAVGFLWVCPVLVWGYYCGLSLWGLSVAGMGVLLWSFYGFVRCWYGGTAVEFLLVCPLLVWRYCCGLSLWGFSLLVWGYCCGVSVGLSVAGMGYSYGLSLWGFPLLVWGYCCRVSMDLSVAGMGVMLWSFYGFVRCWYGGIAVEFLWICPLLVWG